MRERRSSSNAVHADEGHQKDQAEVTNEHDKEEENRPIPEAVGPDVKAA
jgi:hypothetical protein